MVLSYEELEAAQPLPQTSYPRIQNTVELAQNLALLDAVIEATSDAILVYSLDKYILKINNRYCEMMRIDKYEASKFDLEHHIELLHCYCSNSNAFISRFQKFLNVPKEDKNFILKFKNNRYYSLTNTPYMINGQLLGRVLIFNDITNQKKIELDLIEREALYKDLSIRDNLTGIYNRRKILIELKTCYELAKPHKDPTSLIMFDLNDFKTINDSYGHAMGDFVLQRVTESITGCLRKKDIFGRWGGDEFIILLPDSDRAKAEKTTYKIQSRLSNLGLPIKTPVSCTFGISTTEEEKCPESLIHKADMAMYLTKNMSKRKTRP